MKMAANPGAWSRKLTRPFEPTESCCFPVCSSQPGAYHSAWGVGSRIMHLVRGGAAGAYQLAEGKSGRTRVCGGTKCRYISKHVGYASLAPRYRSAYGCRSCTMIATCRR